MTQTELVSLVYALPEEQLRDLNSLSAQRLREMHHARSAQAKLALFPGQRVRFIGRSGKGLVHGVSEGAITEIMRSRVSVKFDGDWRTWTVSPTLLEPLSKPVPVNADDLIAGITTEEEPV